MDERSSPLRPVAADHDVLQYLAAIESRRSAPSTFPNPERIVDDLSSAEMMQPDDDAEGLRDQLAAHTPGTEAYIERLEERFVADARAYGERHGVGYQAWIEAGVDPSVLERAGIRSESD